MLRGGDARAAAEHFRESLRLGPGNADAHAGLGQALERLGRVGEALREYEAAVRLNPEHPARERLAALRPHPQ